MAAGKKYAGLPDLDAAPEIYETPDLADDVSTAPTNTVRTGSPTPSTDVHNENFDTSQFDREAARRRFEPSLVDARDTNLSDTVNGKRSGYKTARRRRQRKVRMEDGSEEFLNYEDISDEEETLSKRLARLKREAEEIKLELAHQEENAAGDVDSGEHHDQSIGSKLQELDKVLDGLRLADGPARGYDSLEQAFSQQLARGKSSASAPNHHEAKAANEAHQAPSSSSNLSSISAFADRLTALENALGISTTTPAQQASSILPQLSILTTQIDLVQTTLAPRVTASSQINMNDDGTGHLESLAQRLRSLQAQTDHLVATRKMALDTLKQLHEARLRGSATSSLVYARYLEKRDARLKASALPAAELDDTAATDQQESKSKSRSNAAGATTGTSTVTSGQKNKEMDIHEAQDRVLSDMLLDDQAAKITALYNILPSIQQLQPLLPVVLDRLRALSVVHASAADASRDLSGLEGRLGEWEKELSKWRSAVEGVEKGIEEAKETMRGNVEVVSGMVRGVEERLDALSSQR